MALDRVAATSPIPPAHRPVAVRHLNPLRDPLPRAQGLTLEGAG